MRESRFGTKTWMPAAAAAFLLVVPAVQAGPPGPMQDWVTLSVALKGPDESLRDSSETSLDLPECPQGTEFLVLGISGGPSMDTPSDARRSVGAWAVYAEFVQQTTGTRERHHLAAYGSGRAHASASLGAGQPASPGSGRIRVGAVLVSSPSAKRFRIDVTGACGTASVR